MGRTVVMVRTGRGGQVKEVCRQTVVSGERLLDSLRRAGFAPETPCGGKGSCGRCRVILIPESADNPMESWVSGPVLADRLTEWKKKGESVLACQTFLAESGVILIPEADVADLSELSVSSPFMETVEKGRYAVAVDLGTTTLAAALIDLDSGRTVGTVTGGNPQTAYGADILSRIAEAQNGTSSLAELRTSANVAVANLIRRLTDGAAVDRRSIERVAVAGNSVMEYLFLGRDPSPMGRFPFAPPDVTFPPISPDTCGLANVAPKSEVILLPILTGFIGGDLTAGIFALEAAAKLGEGSFDFGHCGPEILIDVGTNGEILLFHEGEIFAASTAAGPVFEGAGIRYGMRALPGAVASFRAEGGKIADPSAETTAPKDSVHSAFSAVSDDIPPRSNTAPAGELSSRFHPVTIDGVPAVGICGSGLVDIIAEFLRFGLIRPNGKLAEPVRIAAGRDVFLTPPDVRQVQLAVGAIRAGLSLLLKTAGVTPSAVRRIHLAGGFGSALNRENARRIGLLPPEIPTDRIRYCGNTSLLGASAILKNPDWPARTVAFREKTTHLELAVDSNFPLVYAKSMIFPTE